MGALPSGAFAPIEHAPNVLMGLRPSGTFAPCTSARFGQSGLNGPSGLPRLSIEHAHLECLPRMGVCPYGHSAYVPIGLIGQSAFGRTGFALCPIARWADCTIGPTAIWLSALSAMSKWTSPGASPHGPFVHWPIGPLSQMGLC